MLRNLLVGGVAALFLVAPAVAAEPVSETAKILDELRDLKKSINDRLDQLDRSVRDAQNRAASVDEKLYRLQREAVTTDDLRPLRTQIEQLQRDLAAVRGEVGGVRQSLKPALDSPNISRSIPLPLYGTLRVRNDYFTPMDVVVNGARFTVLPGGDTDILVPTGSFNYQVIGVDAMPRTNTMFGGRVHPIRIHPL